MSGKTKVIAAVQTPCCDSTFALIHKAPCFSVFDLILKTGTSCICFCPTAVTIGALSLSRLCPGLQFCEISLCHFPCSSPSVPTALHIDVFHLSHKGSVSFLQSFSFSLFSPFPLCSCFLTLSVSLMLVDH